MFEGFYSVSFDTPLGEGAGVLFLDNGKVCGGDSSMYYLGAYHLKDGNLEADLRISMHTKPPGYTSVFGVDDAVLRVSATPSGDGVIVGKAVSPQAPGVVMNMKMSRISG